MVANMQAKRSRRRKWTLQLTVETEREVATTANHPLKNVSTSGREVSRQQTLGGVLAAIAARREQVESQEHEHRP